MSVFCGTVRDNVMNTSYSLYISSNKIYTSLHLFKGKDNEGNKIRPQTLYFYGKNHPSFVNNYLIGSIVATNSGNKIRGARDTSLPNRLFRIYGSLMGYIETHNIRGMHVVEQGLGGEGSIVTNERKELLNCKLSFNDIVLEIGYENGSYLGYLVDVNYSESLGQVIENSIKEGLYSSRLKSFEYLKATNDLSWILNPDGSFKRDYQVVLEDKELMDLHDMCYDYRNESPFVGLDIEATGVDFHLLDSSRFPRDEVTAIIISPKKGISRIIPIGMLNTGRNFTHAHIIKVFQKMFRELPFIGHNSMFDFKAIYSCFNKLWVNFQMDTRGMNFLLDPDNAKGFNKLKYLTHKHLGWNTLELSEITGKGGEGLYHHFDIDTARLYGGPDTDSLLELYDIFVEMFKEKGHTKWRQAHQIDRDVAPYLAISEMNGIPLSKDDMSTLGDTHKKALKIFETMMKNFLGFTTHVRNISYKKKMSFEEAADEAKSRLEPKDYPNLKYDINVGSPPKLNKAIQNVLRYPIVSRTKSGSVSFGKDVRSKLLGLERDSSKETLWWLFPKDIELNGSTIYKAEDARKTNYPFLYLASLHSEFKKSYTSYIEPALKGQTDNRVFSGNSLESIVTGRISNAAQTFNNTIKKAVKATPGYYLMNWDFAQVEPRKMAGLAGFTDLVKLLDHPEGDYHIIVVHLIKGVEMWAVSKSERSAFKVVSLGVPYGLEEYKMAMQMFETLEPTPEQLFETRTRREIYYVKMKPILDLLDKYSDMAVEQGYIETAEGRRRYFDLGKMSIGSVRREGRNMPIQGSCSSDLKIAITEFMRLCEKEDLDITKHVKLLVTVHDEGLGESIETIHPFFNLKNLYNSHAKKVDGFPKYYIGVSIPESWYQGKKDDAAEIPPLMLEEIVKKDWPKEVPREEVPAKGWHVWVREQIDLWVKNYLITYVEDIIHGDFDQFSNVWLLSKTKAYLGDPPKEAYLKLKEEQGTEGIVEDLEVKGDILAEFLNLGDNEEEKEEGDFSLSSVIERAAFEVDAEEYLESQKEIIDFKAYRDLKKSLVDARDMENKRWGLNFRVQEDSGRPLDLRKPPFRLKAEDKKFFIDLFDVTKNELEGLKSYLKEIAKQPDPENLRKNKVYFIIEGKAFYTKVNLLYWDRERVYELTKRDSIVVIPKAI